MKLLMGPSASCQLSPQAAVLPLHLDESTPLPLLLVPLAELVAGDVGSSLFAAGLAQSLVDTLLAHDLLQQGLFVGLLEALLELFVAVPVVEAAFLLRLDGTLGVNFCNLEAVPLEREARCLRVAGCL